MPTTVDDWIKIEKEFADKWNMPHCIGALDGKHITMSAPEHSGAIYRNYKGTFSIVLMALVDANYRFLYVDVGCNGRVSDGGIFNGCSLGKGLAANTLNLPPPAPMPGIVPPMPYYFVADDAFALKENLMKPFPFRNMTHEQRIFNYRLSRARRIVENAFGIIAQRFRCMRVSINLQPDKVESIALACCALHNMLRSKSIHSSMGVEVDEEDVTSGQIRPGNWRATDSSISLAPQVGSQTRASTNAKAVRELLCAYVNSEIGSVPWQDSMIF
jgi:hypothetical protein